MDILKYGKATCSTQLNSSDYRTMEVQTEYEVYENQLLKPLPEAPEGTPLRSSSRGGSPVSHAGSIHRLFSFKSGFERLNLHVPSDLPNEKAPFSANETQKSITSPNEQQRFTPLSNPPPEPSTWETFYYGWWTVELLAFVVSFASLIAIILILRHYDGHSQPDWPHNITLNSVLSWFTTLFKASLLVPVAACFGQASWAHYRSSPRPLTDLAIYDSASRGPMGSMQLLWYFRAKHVASIGAIATVLALGVDPIVQQTLSIKADVVISTNSATIGRAQSFVQWDLQDYSTYYDVASGSQSGPLPNSRVLLPPTDMVAAMFDGMFSGASGSGTSSSGPNLSCPTGNCTFLPFQTLAVCSECKNITNALSKKCHSKRGGSVRAPPEAISFCEYSLPNGLKMNKTFGPSTVATNGSLASVGPLPCSQSILNFTGIWSGAPLTAPDPQPPYDISVMGKANEAALSTKDVAATQCFLYWCVNTMQAVVINGQISETKMDSWHDETTLRLDNFGSNFFLYVSINATWNLQPPSLNPNDSPSDFVITRYASQALNNWLAAHLTISTSKNFDSDWRDDKDYYATDPSHREFEKQRLLLQTNITAIFENLAASMSQYLRITSIDSQRLSPGSLNVLGVGPANGTATSREILVSVRWPWLAFPAALLLTALVFFFLTLLSTSRHQLEVWKLSPFPLIFNRVDESQLAPQSEMSPIVRSVKILDMERRAANVSARLEEWDDGPRLTSSSGHLRHMLLPEGYGS
ncbi:MAG: hypothetical protein Q9181_001227 [Wetmoreana brouardii]